MSYASPIHNLKDQVRHRFNRNLRSRWVLAHLKAFALTWVVMLMVTCTWEQQDAEYFLPLFGTVFGALLGHAQWKVLRQHFPEARHWVAASAAGITLGWLLALAFFSLFYECLFNESNLAFYCVFAAFLGLGLGYAQGLSLRPCGIKKQPWIIANVSGWLAGAIVVYSSLNPLNAFPASILIYPAVLLVMIAGASALAFTTYNTLLRLIPRGKDMPYKIREN
jgi:hypothetical protein